MLGCIGKTSNFSEFCFCFKNFHTPVHEILKIARKICFTQIPCNKKFSSVSLYDRVINGKTVRQFLKTPKGLTDFSSDE